LTPSTAAVERPATSSITGRHRGVADPVPGQEKKTLLRDF
jgi:hypothetical protein